MFNTHQINDPKANELSQIPRFKRLSSHFFREQIEKKPGQEP